MYADDTVLLSKGDSLDVAMNRNQHLFELYINWADINCLNINILKTKNMIICSRYKNVAICGDKNVIHKGSQHVSQVDNYVYLGVDVDSHLTFETFLKSILRKVNYKLYLFSKIRFLLTFTAAVMVYKQMVLPFFDYLDILIDSGPKKYIDRLQALQFRGIKIIYQYYFNDRRIKNSDEAFLHKELKLSYLKIRRIRHLLQMMYNLVQRRPDMLDLRDKGICLRSSQNVNFKEEKLNSEIYVKGPNVRGSVLWKKLPPSIQKANTTEEFNRLLTDDLLESIFKT